MLAATLSIFLCGYQPLTSFVEQRRRKSDGSIPALRNCISLRCGFYVGWRNVKKLASGECHKIRDSCIVNAPEIFL